ncbi:N-acetylglucosamine kinase [Flavihumibacter stibioxidans]|uniref:N-acetylglucosamine kinase n=1 Tax=Flavihumibacter stibioxidans TaxID=1834163 RepID=A0ABR7MAT7_9BACT|nr:N-acetylglucosamine kinase [Flavihumibacter stibioxidans]MBC6492154.1 N-acetylglucosamine kinase [Flavihumibacter stibioxidans]
MAILIADSGATKCEWCVVDKGKIKKTVFTLGISPYFFSGQQVEDLVRRDLYPEISRYKIEAIYYYGTGCKNPANQKMIRNAIRKVFPSIEVTVDNDLMGAARAVCQHEKGIACILGTGSNSCYFNGKKIAKNSPGLGYVLGDEGSGAYLGKKVIQYYLYNTFDEELRFRFEDKYKMKDVDILDSVYKQPLPNRFLASFTLFLAENRGHYMIENIIEDGLNDFFFQHVIKYNESWKLPVHFVGGVAYGFRDVVMELCSSYELELGTILQHPMEGLIVYHK